jgi:hypothetical protein
MAHFHSTSPRPIMEVLVSSHGDSTVHEYESMSGQLMRVTDPQSHVGIQGHRLVSSESLTDVCGTSGLLMNNKSSAKVALWAAGEVRISFTPRSVLFPTCSESIFASSLCIRWESLDSRPWPRNHNISTLFYILLLPIRRHTSLACQFRHAVVGLCAVRVRGRF